MYADVAGVSMEAFATEGPMRFRSPTREPVRVETTSGHSASVGWEWTELPNSLHRAAIDAGCEFRNGGDPKYFRKRMTLQELIEFLALCSDEFFDPQTGFPSKEMIEKELRDSSVPPNILEKAWRKARSSRAGNADNEPVDEQDIGAQEPVAVDENDA